MSLQNTISKQVKEAVLARELDNAIANTIRKK